ncbi:hypothetical protein E4U43_003414 [Claviceps pusilla]|uniref:Dopa 4,5-dioxygenase n=1 Tax=Claviceps pusilla TaxID=123648 RepID=A0A9P7SWS4_9HYPO|nr:hypothetical protein E4U43_003414 [Claviceps pusilla]
MVVVVTKFLPLLAIFIFLSRVRGSVPPAPAVRPSVRIRSDRLDWTLHQRKPARILVFNRAAANDSPSPSPSPSFWSPHAPPLSEDRQDDGKSLVNPRSEGLSEMCSRFEAPLDNGIRGGFDVHIYYLQHNTKQSRYTWELWERPTRMQAPPNNFMSRRSVPELKMHQLWPGPIGPHPVAMFEVNVFTPAGFLGPLSPMAVWRGPLSVLIHPNSVAEEGEDESRVGRAIWMGERNPLDLEPLGRAA